MFRQMKIKMMEMRDGMGIPTWRLMMSGILSVPQFTCNIVCLSFYLLNLLFEQKAFIKQSKERS